MLPKVDFGNFYKFVASVGLFLIFASVAAPWLFYQSLTILTLTEQQLKDLSPLAEQVIRERQMVVDCMQQFVGVAAVLLFLGGAAILAWGLIAWRKRQGAFDADEDLAYKQRRLEFEPLTKDEIQERYAEDGDEKLATPVATGAEAKNSASDTPGNEQPVREREYIDRMRISRQADEKILNLVDRTYSHVFDVRSQVKIASGTAQSAVDIVLDPRPGQPFAQLALEVKVLKEGFLGYVRISELMSRLAIASHEFAAGYVYSRKRGRLRPAEASGVLFIVTNDTDGSSPIPDPRRVLRETQVVRDVNNSLRRGIGVVRLSLSTLDEIDSDSLADAVSRAWADPNDVQDLRFG